MNVVVNVPVGSDVVDAENRLRIGSLIAIGAAAGKPWPVAAIVWPV